MAAVAIIIPEYAGIIYAEAIKTAREKFPLAETGIAGCVMRRAITGGFIFEVPDEDGAPKADLLAEKMRSVLGERGVRIVRPTKSAYVRISVLDDSVIAEDVASALAHLGGCPEEEVKIGEIRRAPSRLGSAWARVLFSVVRKAAETGRVVVGVGCCGG